MLSCVAQIGAAIDFGNDFALHGYGSQDYAQTTDNTYLRADHRGTWDDNFLAFVGTVSLNERSKLWAQLETSSMDTTRFTWFFVDYQLTDSATAHVGRVKFPLGLYNEIIDVKFLQLSSLEPLLYQSAADFAEDIEGIVEPAAAPARVVTLAISDVPGDDPAVIGSGPTVPDATTFAEARALIARYGIVPPPAVAARLARDDDETPKPGSLPNAAFHMIATPMMAPSPRPTLGGVASVSEAPSAWAWASAARS